ncbi:Hpt domain-containing protein [Sphingobacterium sp. Mn56C]|uniref:Hpt domain-containing protein n=1 Tax=Sphingobacterium sp. Mn56C TaxID=3395261 RepID=UPI003BC0DBB2
MEFKLINPQEITAAMMDNNTLIKQFVEMYLFQSPIDFQALQQSIKNENKQSIADHAHHIKPTMAYIGAKTLQNNFQELEDLGKSGAEMTIIRDKFQRVHTDFNCMLKELADFNKTL